MLVLALDTSTPAVTAGVVAVKRPHELIAALSTGRDPQPVELLAEQSWDDPFAHAERLMPLVRRALADSGNQLADLEAVVVGLGPGPFTGLRVGIVTAASLGDALSVPVHGVPSHDGMAKAAGVSGPFLVATDARRREVYLSGYDADGARVCGPEVLAPAAVAQSLGDFAPAAVAGAGAGLLAPTLGLPEVPVAGSLSAGLVACAVLPLLTSAVPGPLTPLYLRRPDATPPAERPKPMVTGPGTA